MPILCWNLQHKSSCNNIPPCKLKITRHVHILHEAFVPQKCKRPREETSHHKIYLNDIRKSSNWWCKVYNPCMLQQVQSQHLTAANYHHLVHDQRDKGTLPNSWGHPWYVQYRRQNRKNLLNKLRNWQTISRNSSTHPVQEVWIPMRGLENCLSLNSTPANLCIAPTSYDLPKETTAYHLN